MGGRLRITFIIVAFSWALFAGCGTTEQVGDASGELDALEDVVWEECPAPSSIEVYIDGPENTEPWGVNIDTDGLVTSISTDTDGRMALDVDFSVADPELGTVTFTLPSWVADTVDLAVDDNVHVAYHYKIWFWETRCLVIDRGGMTLVAGAINDITCPPIDDLDAFEIGDLIFRSGTSDCEPHVGPCTSWRRLYLDVSCPELVDPVRVLDGSDTDLTCGPGYRMALTQFTRYYREIRPCTDQPEGKFALLAASR